MFWLVLNVCSLICLIKNMSKRRNVASTYLPTPVTKSLETSPSLIVCFGSERRLLSSRACRSHSCHPERKKKARFPWNCRFTSNGQYAFLNSVKQFHPGPVSHLHVVAPAAVGLEHGDRLPSVKRGLVHQRDAGFPLCIFLLCIMPSLFLPACGQCCKPVHALKRVAAPACSAATAAAHATAGSLEIGLLLCTPTANVLQRGVIVKRGWGRG